MEQGLRLLLALVILAPVFLIRYLKTWGLVLSIILFAVTLFVAFKVEKEKNKHDIHTYKEILAFTEGKTLDEISKAREEGKRGYQQVWMFLVGALVGVLIFMLVSFFA